MEDKMEERRSEKERMAALRNEILKTMQENNKILSRLTEFITLYFR